MISLSLDSTRKSPFLLAVLLAAVLLPGAPAKADPRVAVIIPPAIAPGVPAVVTSRALDTLTRLLENSDDHFSVISYGQAIEMAEADQIDRFERPKGEQDAAQCTSEGCAVWFRRVLNADLAVQLRIANRVDEKKRLQPSSVDVLLLEDAEARWTAEEAIQGQHVEDAVTKAFDSALAKRRRGAGPWVTVRGTPEGAQVRLDDEIIGQIPVSRARVHNASNLHVLTVHAKGFDEHRESLDFHGDSSHEEVVNVQLAPAGTAAAATAANNDRAKKGWIKAIDYGVGSVLVVAGAMHIALGARNLRREDDCARSVDGICSERYGDQNSVPGSWIAVGAGVGAVLAGAAVAYWTPIWKLSTRTSQRTAMLVAERSF
jgi:hypothetical protein